MNRRTFLAVAGGTATAGCLDSVTGDSSHFFERVQVEDGVNIRVGLNHDVLDEDDEVATIVLVDERGEEVESESYSEDEQSVVLAAINRSSISSKRHFSYGALTIQAQNDFGDVFTERQFEYAPDLEVVNVSAAPEFTPRDDPPHYSSRDRNSWGRFELTFEITNAGNAPVFFSELSFDDVDGIVGVTALSSRSRTVWREDPPDVIPADGANAVTVGYDISQTHETDPLERTVPCGESYAWSLTFEFEGDVDLTVPLEMALQGDKHVQYGGYSFVEDRTYCTEFVPRQQ